MLKMNHIVNRLGFGQFYHQLPKKYVFLSAFLLAGAMATTGCKASECQQMMQCCHAVKDMKGVGKRACGPLAEATKDPNTCREIIKTIGYMAKDRKKPIPAACQMSKK